VANQLDADAIAEQLAALRQAEPLLADDFRRNTGIWEQPEYDGVSFAFAGGAYRITVDAPNVTPGSTGDIDVADFLLEVDAAQTDGPDGQYGLFFRQQDDQNFYLYTVSPAQSYALWRMVDGEWTELIPWTDADAIHPGSEVNRLGVLAQGSQLTLLVNDVPVTQFEDDTFASGKVALSVGTFDEGGVAVEFDNLSIWEAQ
jgi:hypothetical protein